MNEVQLIRSQLALERAHASAVANACATAPRNETSAGSAGEVPGSFRRACVDYLACVLAWFEERDQRLADLVHARLDPADPARSALDEVLARRGRSRDALTKLEAACAAAARRQGWVEFAEYFNGMWDKRRDALDALLASNMRAGDWRAFGGIDADSILEERRRYALVVAQVPPGVTLGAAAGRP